MIKAVLTLGIVMTVGSGVIAYDYTQQAALSPNEPLDIAIYGQDLQKRLAKFVEAQLEQAADTDTTPQTATAEVEPDIAAPEPDTSILAEAEPAQSADVQGDLPAPGENLFSGLLENFSLDRDVLQIDRLFASQKKAAPSISADLSQQALSEMSTMEMFANRGAIQQSFASNVTNTNPYASAVFD